MSTPTDKEIAWQGRIQERAAAASKAILDRLERYPKSGFASLAPADRRDIAEHVAKQVIDTMLNLGTFVTAGAQDYQVATLEQVTIKGSDKVKLQLVPAIADGKPINLDLLAQNSGKQVVVAFINGIAYDGAREALSKAIHREQTDWINREQDRLADEAEQQPAGGVIEATATATVANISARAEGDLIADQPGEDSGNEEASETREQGANDGRGGEPEGTEGAGPHPVAGPDGAGDGSERANQGDAVPPEPPVQPRKPRRGRAGWAGHH